MSVLKCRENVVTRFCLDFESPWQLDGVSELTQSDKFVQWCGAQCFDVSKCDGTSSAFKHKPQFLSGSSEE